MNYNQRNRVIFHIDIDSFFVGAELTLRPELKEVPDIAISQNHYNSVVVALSNGAKQKGAKVPMKLYEVKKYVPNITVIKPNNALYSKLSSDIFSFLRKKYTNQIEIGSIDEWYLDATNIWKKYGDIKSMAINIQKSIFNQFKLDVSIGISWNKFLAKISTEINKPRGITITNQNNFVENIQNQDISKYVGIGIATIDKLRDIGINTIKDLANKSVDDIELKRIFKNKLKIIIDNAKGIGDDFVDVNKNKLKIISNSSQFIKPTNDINQICEKYREIAHLVHSRLVNKQCYGNKISISIMKNHKRTSTTLSFLKPTNSFDEIYQTSIFLFNKLWNSNQEISGVGIAIISLSKINDTYIQDDIFSPKKEQIINESKVLEIVNKINSTMKKDCLLLASNKKKSSLLLNMAKVKNKV